MVRHQDRVRTRSPDTQWGTNTPGRFFPRSPQYSLCLKRGDMLRPLRGAIWSSAGGAQRGWVGMHQATHSLQGPSLLGWLARGQMGWGVAGVGWG